MVNLSFCLNCIKILPTDVLWDLDWSSEKVSHVFGHPFLQTISAQVLTCELSGYLVVIEISLPEILSYMWKSRIFKNVHIPLRVNVSNHKDWGTKAKMWKEIPHHISTPNLTFNTMQLLKWCSLSICQTGRLLGKIHHSREHFSTCPQSGFRILCNIETVPSNSSGLYLACRLAYSSIFGFLYLQVAGDCMAVNSQIV